MEKAEHIDAQESVKKTETIKSPKNNQEKEDDDSRVNKVVVTKAEEYGEQLKKLCEKNNSYKGTFTYKNQTYEFFIEPSPFALDSKVGPKNYYIGITKIGPATLDYRKMKAEGVNTSNTIFQKADNEATREQRYVSFDSKNWMSWGDNFNEKEQVVNAFFDYINNANAQVFLDNANISNLT